MWRWCGWLFLAAGCSFCEIPDLGSLSLGFETDPMEAVFSHLGRVVFGRVACEAEVADLRGRRHEFGFKAVEPVCTE